MIILPDTPKTIWFLSDHHLGHENILTFRDQHGQRYRPFGSLAEMHEEFVDRHNEVVRDRDHVYFMGDVAMKLTEDVKAVLARMRGKKRLIRGNHDVAKTRSYLEIFAEIHGMRVMNNILFTHIPIHPACLGRFRGNAHGHVHVNTLSDPRYVNMCPEVRGYTPISLESVSELILRGAEHGCEQ